MGASARGLGAGAPGPACIARCRHAYIRISAGVKGLLEGCRPLWCDIFMRPCVCCVRPSRQRRALCLLAWGDQGTRACSKSGEPTLHLPFDPGGGFFCVCWMRASVPPCCWVEVGRAGTRARVCSSAARVRGESRPRGLFATLCFLHVGVPSLDQHGCVRWPPCWHGLGGSLEPPQRAPCMAHGVAALCMRMPSTTPRTRPMHPGCA